MANTFTFHRSLQHYRYLIKHIEIRKEKRLIEYQISVSIVTYY